MRRLGKVGAEAEPSNHRLSAVFMAAAPKGISALAFEDEEVAVLEATGTIGIDLRVEESGELKRLAECVAEHGNGELLDVLHFPATAPRGRVPACSSKPIATWLFTSVSTRPSRGLG